MLRLSVPKLRRLKGYGEKQDKRIRAGRERIVSF